MNGYVLTSLELLYETHIRQLICLCAGKIEDGFCRKECCVACMCVQDGASNYERGSSALRWNERGDSEKGTSEGCVVLGASCLKLLCLNNPTKALSQTDTGIELEQPK
jgi:hypothetical protein